MSRPKPLPALTPEAVEKFWSLVEKRGPNKCWPWKGGTTRGMRGGSPYGIWGTQRQYVRPHRVAYELEFGPIPDGHTLDHVKARGCSTTLCCNPAHLEPVTQSENILRHFGATPEVCRNGHTRIPGQQCPQCKAAISKRYGDKNRERIRRVNREYAQRQKLARQSLTQPQLERKTA